MCHLRILYSDSSEWSGDVRDLFTSNPKRSGYLVGTLFLRPPYSISLEGYDHYGFRLTDANTLECYLWASYMPLVHRYTVNLDSGVESLYSHVNIPIPEFLLTIDGEYVTDEHFATAQATALSWEHPG